MNKSYFIIIIFLGMYQKIYTAAQDEGILAQATSNLWPSVSREESNSNVGSNVHTNNNFNYASNNEPCCDCDACKTIFCNFAIGCFACVPCVLFLIEVFKK